MIAHVKTVTIGSDAAVGLVRPLLIAEHRFAILNHTAVWHCDAVVLVSVNKQRRSEEGSAFRKYCTICVKRAFVSCAFFLLPSVSFAVCCVYVHAPMWAWLPPRVPSPHLLPISSSPAALKPWFPHHASPDCSSSHRWYTLSATCVTFSSAVTPRAFVQIASAWQIFL